MSLLLSFAGSWCYWQFIIYIRCFRGNIRLLYSKLTSPQLPTTTRQSCSKHECVLFLCLTVVSVSSQSKQSLITLHSFGRRFGPKQLFIFSHAHTSRGNRMLLHKLSHMGLKSVLMVFTCLYVGDSLTLGKKTSAQSRLGGLDTFVFYCKCDFPFLWTAACPYKLLGASALCFITFKSK